MRPFVVYSLARLTLFAASAGILYLLGARGFLLLGLAVLISGLVSVVLLSGQRDALSRSVSSRAGAVRKRIEDTRSREDSDG